MNNKNELAIGDKVKNKEDGSEWEVIYSSFGFSLKNGRKQTLGMSEEEILKNYDKVKDPNYMSELLKKYGRRKK